MRFFNDALRKSLHFCTDITIKYDWKVHRPDRALTLKRNVKVENAIKSKFYISLLFM